MKKTTLRKTIKARLAELSPKQLSAAGTAAAGQLPLLSHWDEFRSVLAFFSMQDEINTTHIMETILKEKKILFAPKIEGQTLVFYRVNQNDLEHCVTAANNISFGIGYREPKTDPDFILKPEDFPALVITPGIAFDRNLNRLGRGRGYYDRFFASLDAARLRYTALGLCMPCQLVEEVPSGHQDKKMDALLTETSVINK